MQLHELPNVGKVLEEKLMAAGVDTPEALQRLGSREALRRIRASVDEGACLHMLYALEGAVRGVRKTELPATVKAELKDFLRELDR